MEPPAARVPLEPDRTASGGQASSPGPGRSGMASWSSPSEGKSRPDCATVVKVVRPVGRSTLPTVAQPGKSETHVTGWTAQNPRIVKINPHQTACRRPTFQVDRRSKPWRHGPVDTAGVARRQPMPNWIVRPQIHIHLLRIKSTYPATTSDIARLRMGNGEISAWPASERLSTNNSKTEFAVIWNLLDGGTIPNSCLANSMKRSVASHTANGSEGFGAPRAAITPSAASDRSCPPSNCTDPWLAMNSGVTFPTSSALVMEAMYVTYVV